LHLKEQDPVALGSIGLFSFPFHLCLVILILVIPRVSSLSVTCRNWRWDLLRNRLRECRFQTSDSSLKKSLHFRKRDRQRLEIIILTLLGFSIPLSLRPQCHFRHTQYLRQTPGIVSCFVIDIGHSLISGLRQSQIERCPDILIGFIPFPIRKRQNHVMALPRALLN
jgi:hypothetical protein